MPRTVIFIAGTFPHAVADFLVEHGYIVLEAHDAEEALPLSNQTNVDAVIVAVTCPQSPRMCSYEVELS